MAAGLDRARALAAAHPPRKTRRTPAVFYSLAGRICILAGRAALAPPAVLGNRFRLGGPLVLLCFLSAAVYRALSNCRQSTPPARDSGRAGGLDRPGTRPGASLDRHDHGQSRPHPVPLGVFDPNQRHGGRIRRKFPGDVHGGLPCPSTAL
jgi:hypothetical protein